MIPASLLLAALPALTLTPQDEPTIRFGDPADLSYTKEFFPGTTYDPAIPTPNALLGQPVGSRAAHHHEVVTYMRQLAEASPRVTVERFGRTHEGRELLWVAISMPNHIEKLDEIRADHQRLADPRGLSDADGKAIVERTLPVAWLAYSIHGDEMSGVDAALAVAYHLAAGTSENVTNLLENALVVIDPIQNPDGRQRILTQLEQNAGYVGNLDHASMHRGRWPYGRGNHYLFDMNRDWLPGSQPETRARWKAVRSFAPQLFVDAHEMGSLDTYLFYPAREPINGHVPPYLKAWWRVFGDEQASAFDDWGWSYYTREWADYWYPGYSDAWGSFNGAIGILYEQARYMAQSIRRASGEIITYREAVHHQAVSSIANVSTLVSNGATILGQYLEHRRDNVAADTPGNDRVFVVEAGADPDRRRSLIRTLLGQGIEVFELTETAAANNAEGHLGQVESSREFKPGALVVPARQPQGSMVKTILEFDPRLSKEVLEKERKELERKGSSTMYDVTAWSLAHTHDLESWWVDAGGFSVRKVEAVPIANSGIVAAPNEEAHVYGWLVDGDADGAVRFAARALDDGLAVHISDEAFLSAGREFARGSLLVRAHENPDGNARDRVETAAKQAGVQAFATTSGRAPEDGADLGGGHFTLLARPRVALLSNAPVSTSDYGHTWHTLDVKLGIPFTLLNAQSFGGYDLRRYNVLILPPGGTSGIIRDNADTLRNWVRGGGTLIAIGSSASAVLGDKVGLSSVKLRRSMLDDLDDYAFAVERERAAGKGEIDEGVVWGDSKGEAPAEETEGSADETTKTKEAPVDSDKSRQDSWERTFSPQGAFVRGEVNHDEWLTVGCNEELPVLFAGSRVLLATRPVHTAVRIANEDRIRLGGLVWPEARKRIADSAWATVERRGNGQVILFATSPNFRGMLEGCERLLMNAVVYGPGAGANQPMDW